LIAFYFVSSSGLNRLI